MANSYFNENTLEELIEEIKYVYKSDDRPWIIGYSGGKDSTTVVELVYKMLLGLEPDDRHKNVYIVSSDTLIENPLIKIYLNKMNDLLGQAADRDGLPIKSAMVMPLPNNSFWANVIGRGFPTPRMNGTFRWCTDRLKINPSGQYIEGVIDKEGKEVVVLLGVRKAESIARKRRIEGRELTNRLLNRHETIQDAYVRNAVFTMCGMDVFEIIRKFTRGYVTRNNSIDDDEAYDTYESARQQMERLETEKKNLKLKVYNLTKDLEDIEVQLTELATAFKNAGGISRKEKKQLEDEYNHAEKVKTETLTNIKIFVEGLMPFYILKDFANPIMAQLDFEEKGEIFYYVQSKLKRETISELLKGDVSDLKVDQLMEHLLDTFRPKGFRDDMEMMFDLSKEDIGRVNGIVSSLDDFDVSAMVNMINKRKAASERTAEINRILKNSMREEDINAFAQKENEILKKKDDLSSRLYDSQHRLEDIDKELQSQEQIRDKAIQILKSNAQNN